MPSEDSSLPSRKPSLGTCVLQRLQDRMKHARPWHNSTVCLTDRPQATQGANGPVTLQQQLKLRHSLTDRHAKLLPAHDGVLLCVSCSFTDDGCVSRVFCQLPLQQRRHHLATVYSNCLKELGCVPRPKNGGPFHHGGLQCHRMCRKLPSRQHAQHCNPPASMLPPSTRRGSPLRLMCTQTLRVSHTVVLAALLDQSDRDNLCVPRPACA